MANFEKIYEDSILPLRGTLKSAGYDLYANEDIYGYEYCIIAFSFVLAVLLTLLVLTDAKLFLV